MMFKIETEAVSGKFTFTTQPADFQATVTAEDLATGKGVEHLINLIKLAEQADELVYVTYTE